MEGLGNMFFKLRVVAIWAFFSLYHSLVLFHFTVSGSLNGYNSSGKIVGLWDVNCQHNGFQKYIVVTVNLRLLMAPNSITRWHSTSVAGSILAWLAFLFVYSGIKTPYDRQENIFYVIYVLMSTVYFYLTLLVVPVVALLRDFKYQGLQRWFFPYDYQIIRGIHRNDQVRSRSEFLEIGTKLTPEEARSFAICQLPRESS